MEITNRGVSTTPLTPQPQEEVTAPSAGDQAAPNQAAPSSVQNSSTYTPSPELLRLLDQVRAQPDVRGDRVQAASERLQQGYYHTQTSIEQTAVAMMQSVD